MAAKNVTGDENQKTNLELFCLSELTSEMHNELLGLSALNICLSITAFLWNALILVALYKESSLHPPSKLLYRNLAVTDLCVGIISEPLRVTFWMSVVNKRWNICHFTSLSMSVTSYSLCSVSLGTLTAIGVDRLLALLLGLRYRQVVTLKRTYLTVIVFWVVSIVGGTTFLWNPVITTWYSNIGTILCLLTLIFSYTKIFLHLRHNQMQVQSHVPQGQPNRAIPLNIARYRKAVSTALWVKLTLVVCYLPHGIATALIPQRSLPFSVYLARELTSTLVYLNSSLNPLLYCWKMKEVRKAVKETVGCSSG